MKTIYRGGRPRGWMRCVRWIRFDARESATRDRTNDRAFVKSPSVDVVDAVDRSVVRVDIESNRGD